VLYHIIVFGPLIGAIIAGMAGTRFMGGKLGEKPSMAITTGLLFVSAILSWYAFIQVGIKNIEPGTINVLRWMDVGEMKANWAFKIDTLTVVMLVVVNSVSALVHLYSWGYMSDDQYKPRFFSYLSLFTFAMLMLVTSDNFIQLFFGWEGVGLASYLLIGYYDIKRVIAYSTCSQLGYMFFAAGGGAYNAAMFHLFTHAFFKALLFLCAGSVIHAMHHEQDMRKMGGIRHKVPLTYAAMILGTLAITGIGIPGTKIGFAGFFSKDAIIEAAYSGGTNAAAFAFWAGIIAALMTSFYSWRLIFMTFHGDYRGDKHTLDHAHESPLNMLVPLGLLSIGAVFAGALFYKYFMSNYGDFWHGSLPVHAGEHYLLEDWRY